MPYQHLEKKYFEVGDLGFNVWRMFKDDVIVGQCICNDRRWPETFRVMGLKGAEMVVLGYNTPSDNVYAPHEPPYLRVFHHNLSLQAAAYQNGIWVVATAKAGKEDGFWLHGGSVIVAPTGEIVAKGTTEQDEVISYDCDLALGEYIRNTTFNFAKHRRPEHYKLISERAGVKLEPATEESSMQYAAKDVTPHERYKLLISFVLPRPIAWLTTIGPTGVVNAAPFSFFNVFAEDPPLIMVAINKRADGRIKDSWANIERTGEFVVNLTDEPLAREMHEFERRLSARNGRAGLSRPQDRAVGRHQAAAARRRAVGARVQDLAGDHREGRPPAGDRRGRALPCPRRAVGPQGDARPHGQVPSDRPHVRRPLLPHRRPRGVSGRAGREGEGSGIASSGGARAHSSLAVCMNCATAVARSAYQLYTSPSRERPIAIETAAWLGSTTGRPTWRCRRSR